MSKFLKTNYCYVSFKNKSKLIPCNKLITPILNFYLKIFSATKSKKYLLLK